MPPDLTELEQALLLRVTTAGHQVVFDYNYTGRGRCEADVADYDGALPDAFNIRVGMSMTDQPSLLDVRAHELGHAIHLAEWGYNGAQLARWVKMAYRVDLTDGVTDLLFHPAVYSSQIAEGANPDALMQLHLADFPLGPTVDDIDAFIEWLNSVLSSSPLDAIDFAGAEHFLLPDGLVLAAGRVVERIQNAQSLLANREDARTAARDLQLAVRALAQNLSQ